MANSRSKRNHTKKQDERLPSQGDVIDPTSPQKESPSPQTSSILEIGRSNMVSNNSSSGFHPSALYVPAIGSQRCNYGQHPGNGGISGVDAHRCSGQAPSRRPNVHQSRPRPLIPAARMPNASVIENQKPRYNRQMSANYVSTGRRATSCIYHSSFPYPMGERPSNYRLGHQLPGNSGQPHVEQRYPRHEQFSDGRRMTRLGQPNNLAGISLPVVNQSTDVTFSHPVRERVHLETMHSSVDSRLHFLSQNPVGPAHFHGIEGFNPPSMGPSQSYWPADANRNPISYSTGPPTVPMRESYSQPVSTQFGMNPVPDLGFGQLRSQPGSSVVLAGYQLENYSGFMQSQPASSHISTGWQLQSHPQFPRSIQTLPEALTSQMDTRNRPPYANSQLHYHTPSYQQTAFNPGFPEQIDPPEHFLSQFRAPEHNGQMFEHPAQLLPEESNDVGDFIVDMMDSFDHVV